MRSLLNAQRTTSLHSNHDKLGVERSQGDKSFWLGYILRVEINETRIELLKLFGGEDDADFREYLKVNCYDLHYA